MFVKVDDQELPTGTLLIEMSPQIQCNLVFKEFKLSLNSKSTYVFFSGYKFFQLAEGDQMGFDSDKESKDEDEVEKIVHATKENGGGQLAGTWRKLTHLFITRKETRRHHHQIGRLVERVKQQITKGGRDAVQMLRQQHYHCGRSGARGGQEGGGLDPK